MKKSPLRRICVIAGHYGSGKSEFAVNLAIQYPVDLLIDLDIVNPYFRSREMTDMLMKRGIETVGSTMKQALGSDLPYVSPAAFRPFLNSSVRAIVDLGGDPVGARLMRQFEAMTPTQEMDNLMIVNVYREKTHSAAAIIQMIHQIEESAGLSITGLVNNTNQLRATTWDDLLHGESLLKEVSSQLNIPIRFHSFPLKMKGEKPVLLGEPLELQLFLRQSWLS